MTIDISNAHYQGSRYVAHAVEAAGLSISFIVDPALSVNDRKSESNGHRGIRFHVHYGHLPDIGKREKIFDSGSGWALSHAGRYYLLQDDTLQPGSSPEILIMVNEDLDGGEVYFKKPAVDESVYADLLGYPLNQVLMILLLTSREGVIMHACGINDGGRGYLFLGNSTNGKSTLASLWHEQGAKVLNDDRIIVRAREGAYWMYGTPWHGTFDKISLTAMPIEKIFFLKHGKENILRPKTDSEAVSMILTRSFPPFWDHRAMGDVLNLLDRLVRAVPCYEMHFLPDESVINYVRSMNR